MPSTYSHRHHENHRQMLALLLKDMHPWTVENEQYAKALDRLFRSDEEEQRNWKRGTIRTFGTCLECFGDGSIRNPNWYDDDECQEAEVIDCETCRGCGIVEIIDKPVPPPPFGTDWTNWDGKAPPKLYSDISFIRVRFKDGTEQQCAAGFDWMADRGDNPIVAYSDEIPF